MLKRIKLFFEILFDRRKFYNPLAEPSYRNKLCICGSGYKVKACHGINRVVNRREYEEIMILWNKAKKKK